MAGRMTSTVGPNPVWPTCSGFLRRGSRHSQEVPVCVVTRLSDEGTSDPRLLLAVAIPPQEDDAMSSKKSDDRIVGRLRAAQQDAEAGWYAQGVADGQWYVEEEADQHQLHALEEWQYPADEDEYGLDLATTLQFDWGNFLGEDTSLADRPCYVRGFVDGAMAQWAEIKNRVIGTPTHLTIHTPSPHPEQDMGPCASPAECDCIGVPDPAGVTPTLGTVRPEPARYESKGRLRPGNRRISRHEVRVLLVFRQSPERWLDNAQVAEAANINPRTARLHTAKLVELGVLDVQRVFPASKFRIGRSPGPAGRTYLDHWEQAREAHGINDVAATEAGR